MIEVRISEGRITLITPSGDHVLAPADADYLAMRLRTCADSVRSRQW